MGKIQSFFDIYQKYILTKTVTWYKATVPGVQ